MIRRATPRAGRALVAAAAILAITGALVGDAATADQSAATRERASARAFYDSAGGHVAGRPGTLIAARRMPAPVGASAAWRMTYRSRDGRGRPVAVSAVVAVPHGGRSTRPVIAWAHPTTGAAADCAPSLGRHPFLSIEGSTALLAAGYALVATDYPGMGVPGRSSYLLGVDEADAVLDAARAAHRLTPAVGNRLLLWGHSQGGQAALFAAARAPSYSPDLRVLGVAVAAPAADLPALVRDDLGTLAGVTITSYAVAAMTPAYSDRFGADRLRAILTPEGRARVPRMAELCLSDPELHALAHPLIGHLVTADPGTTAPWSIVLRLNSAPTRIGVPVFIGQGLADELVRPETTTAYVDALCRAGTPTTFATYPRIDHAFAAYAALPAVLRWMREVEGGSRPDGCADVTLQASR